MQLAFAIGFFVVTGLAETLRQGYFGLGPSEISGMIAAVMTLLAVLILRGDLPGLLRPGGDDEQWPGWSWRRTGLALFLVPLFWALPVIWGFASGRLDVVPMSGGALLRFAAMQALTVALAEHLFLREAAIRAFGPGRTAIFTISVLAVFIFHMEAGAQAALAAAGGGVFFLTLRLLGAAPVAVVLVQGLTLALFGHVIPLDLVGVPGWAGAAFLFGGAAVLSLALLTLFAAEKKETRNA